MAKKLELLSPARNVDIGIEAINCGADAVYIGAPAYGARSAATNSVEDIKRLVEYAHVFGVKVYVTLNTILYDNELSSAKALAQSLADVGVDALIVQDFSFLSMELEIPLHASTQMDNRSADKVEMLGKLGFEQVVLARELGLGEILKIHEQCPDITLEAFVHGALCVSYSGKCYASQYCFGRSANRGECAQFCRLSFDLEDEGGNVLVSDRHLLSLKDMNRSMYIEDMADAGVRSFKIEGRLKDMTYVKNVTAFYRKAIDELIARRPDDYQRSSNGCSEVCFETNPNKTFNRGFTDYYLLRSQENVSSLNTPKSIGESVGEVRKVGENFITVGGTTKFHNGDGICFFNANNVLCGCRVNKVEGMRLLLQPFPRELKSGMRLFRNKNVQFEAEVQKKKAVRYLQVDITIASVPKGYRLFAQTGDLFAVELTMPADKEPARISQYTRIVAELQKCALPYFRINNVVVDFDKNYFIPMSTLAQWRRELHHMLVAKISEANRPLRKVVTSGTLPEADGACLRPGDYTLNVSNEVAEKFCMQNLGVSVCEPALEKLSTRNSGKSFTLMTCKYCLRYALGQCLKNKQTGCSVWPPLPRELRLALPDGRKFPLAFDCSKCEMKVKSS